MQSADLEALDDFIAQELLKLGHHNRNAIIEEIHGVRCMAVEETPVLLKVSLKAFQSKLDGMPATKKEVYLEILRLRQLHQQHDQLSEHHDQYQQYQQQQQQYFQSNQMIVEDTTMSIAHQQGSPATTQHPQRDLPVADGPPYSFVDDVDFRLRFLRCELFQVDKAVLRFINYLNLSYELFGAMALKRVVRISDMSKAELRFIRKGNYQILPYRDRAGRSVLVMLGGMDPKEDIMEWAKCYFYVRDAVTRDSVESQRRGVVFVGDVSATMNRDDSGRLLGISSFKYSAHTYAMTKKMIASVPSRIVAVHVCWPDIPGFRVFNLLNVLAKNASSSDYAMRVRVQVGKQTEMRYKLRGYGIPIHLLPLTETGVIKVKYFKEWLRVRKELEEASEGDFAADDNTLDRVVVCPYLADVVFRQGTPSMNNPGNVIFRDTMIAHLEDHHNQHRYLEGHQQQPVQIEIFSNWLIETTVNTKGGRFLEWDKNLNIWVKMVDHQKIKNKVAIAYRDTSKRFLKRQKAARVVQQAAAQESSNGLEVVG